MIVEVTSKLDALAWARVGDVDAVQLPVCRGAEIPEKMTVKIVRWLSGQCAYTFPASRFWRSRRYSNSVSHRKSTFNQNSNYPDGGEICGRQSTVGECLVSGGVDGPNVLRGNAGRSDTGSKSNGGDGQSDEKAELHLGFVRGLKNC